jgi:post-segregation antitoxin (ccd killing protein)/DNA-binding XRE family transcriptional regulator
LSRLQRTPGLTLIGVDKHLMSFKLHDMLLSEWMKKAGVNDRELAARIGVTPVQLGRIRRGKSRASVETAHKISQETCGEISVDDLLGIASKAGVHERGAAYQTSEAVPLTINVSSDLLALARKYGLNVETLIAERGLAGLKHAVKEAYIEHNREAIEASREYVRKYGTIAEQLGIVSREAE